MTVYFGVNKVKDGKRDEYIAELKKNNLEEIFRKQPKNVYYYMLKSISDENLLICIDAWEDRDGFDGHCNSEEVKTTWTQLFEKYVEESIVDSIYEV